MQLWCIINDSSGEAEVMSRSSTAARPLTVCTYPEVCFHLVASNENVKKQPQLEKCFTCFFVPHQVFVLSGVIAMVTCAVFLRLNSLLKLAVLLLAVAVYSYLIHLAFFALTRHDGLHRSEPGAVRVPFF